MTKNFRFAARLFAFAAYAFPTVLYHLGDKDVPWMIVMYATAIWLLVLSIPDCKCKKEEEPPITIGDRAKDVVDNYRDMRIGR